MPLTMRFMLFTVHAHEVTIKTFLLSQRTGIVQIHEQAITLMFYTQLVLLGDVYMATKVIKCPLFQYCHTCSCRYPNVFAPELLFSLLLLTFISMAVPSHVLNSRSFSRSDVEGTS